MVWEDGGGNPASYPMPPDLRDWIPEDDLVHFVLGAVERVDMNRFRVNARGTGDVQYHPRMMLSLLIYCYANGIFSSLYTDLKEQSNLTDPDSRLMRKNKRSEYRQGYNAQAVVDAEGSQLILNSGVSQCANDRNELAVTKIPGVVGQPDTVLADNGYANGDEVAKLERMGVETLVATGAEGRRRRHDFRPEPPGKLVKEPKAEWLVAMKKKMEGEGPVKISFT